ncbi:MAG TPA: TIGR02300 family protein [Candidatus Sulfotelmatobacter sp.]|nr:TIGR02300 family protein [Candidatus Sulfotelmatobacter sp.]
MVKMEWGVKRICHNCGAPFYDLRRNPIVCPKCGTEYDPEAILKSRRTRTPVVEEKDTTPVILDEEAETEVVETEEAEEVEEEEGEAKPAAAAGEGDEEEEEDTIEDASELGEDEDDMAEVIENIEEEDER